MLMSSEQDFTNFLALKDYKRAIGLALAMSQPRRLLQLFTTVLSTPTTEAVTGAAELDIVIRQLGPLDLTRLLKHVRDWNANARTATVAQGVLHAILRLRPAQDIIDAFQTSSKIAKATASEESEGAPERKKGRREPVWVFAICWMAWSRIPKGILPEWIDWCRRRMCWIT